MRSNDLGMPTDFFLLPDMCLCFDECVINAQLLVCVRLGGEGSERIGCKEEKKSVLMGPPEVITVSFFRKTR